MHISWHFFTVKNHSPWGSKRVNIRNSKIQIWRREPGNKFHDCGIIYIFNSICTVRDHSVHKNTKQKRSQFSSLRSSAIQPYGWGQSLPHPHPLISVREKGSNPPHYITFCFALPINSAVFHRIYPARKVVLTRYPGRSKHALPFSQQMIKLTTIYKEFTIRGDWSVGVNLRLCRMSFKQKLLEKR